MKSVAVDIGILVDTRGVHGKRVLEDAVLHMLGSRYRVWLHSDESVKKESLMQRVGGVAFVVGPRVSQVKLVRPAVQTGLFGSDLMLPRGGQAVPHGYVLATGKQRPRYPVDPHQGACRTGPH